MKHLQTYTHLVKQRLSTHSYNQKLTHKGLKERKYLSSNDSIVYVY